MASKRTKKRKPSAELDAAVPPHVETLKAADPIVPNLFGRSRDNRYGKPRKKAPRKAK